MFSRSSLQRIRVRVPTFIERIWRLVLTVNQQVLMMQSKKHLRTQLRLGLRDDPMERATCKE